MNTIPAVASTLSAPHLGQLVADNYLPGRQVSCRLLRAGINDAYLVTAGDERFVWRIYSKGWRTRIEIEAECALLLQLHEAGISVSYPILSAGKDHIIPIAAPEGERFGVLFSFAEGRKLHNYDDMLHGNAGILMGQIHQATAGKHISRIDYNWETLVNAPFRELLAFLPAGDEETAYMHRVHQYLGRQLSSMPAQPFKTGVVHMDIWFDNFNITPEGKITLFDFDFCGNGWQCIDVAYYMMQLFVTEPVEAEYLRKLDAFFTAYQSVCQLSAEEKNMLPALGIALYVFYLGIQCQRFETFSSIFLNEAYLKRFIAVRVRKYADYYKLPIV